MNRTSTERHLLVPGGHAQYWPAKAAPAEEEEEEEVASPEALQAEQPTSKDAQFCMHSNWHRLSG